MEATCPLGGGVMELLQVMSLLYVLLMTLEQLLVDAFVVKKVEEVEEVSLLSFSSIPPERTPP